MFASGPNGGRKVRRTTDGGYNWTSMAGTAIVLAANSCDVGGPSTMISLPGEVNYVTWLATMQVVDG